jgi:hypothetical protein
MPVIQMAMGISRFLVGLVVGDTGVAFAIGVIVGDETTVVVAFDEVNAVSCAISGFSEPTLARFGRPDCEPVHTETA